MKRLYPILTILAGAGYLASLVLYVLTFQDVNAVELPIYWPLTFLMFGVWLAAILKLRAVPELLHTQQFKGFNPNLFLKLMFKGTPGWLVAIAAFSFAFAMVSFVVVMSMHPGVVSIIEGKKVLHNHGHIIRELTDQQYQHALAVQARMPLGHYIAFFGVATAMLCAKHDQH